MVTKMKIEDIIVTHTITPNKPGIEPDMGYIHVRFPLDKNYKPSSDPKDIYERSSRFEKFLNDTVEFEVHYSVDPTPILDQTICGLPSSNRWEIVFNARISLTENYSQEINTAEQVLKDLIVKNYNKFY
jgi:hypothetical protein